MNLADRYGIIAAEADAYFLRNGLAAERVALGAETTVRFLGGVIREGEKCNILEIGCSYGYNLNYILKEFPGVKCFGIDPSLEAVKYGSGVYENISLQQGFSHNLPFQDNFFDVVMLGFCLYTLDRRDYCRTIAEIDRVLKTGGFLAIWDFDTVNSFCRVNKHNDKVPVYKINLYNTFGSNPAYYLAEKHSFSHEGDRFHEDIQERCSLCIFYKEYLENAYL